MTHDAMQLAYVTVATVSGPMAMLARIWIGGVGTGRFMYCANVYMLLLGSGSAPQQPSHPCEAYGEQAQRELPLHIQVTVMVSAALLPQPLRFLAMRRSAATPRDLFTSKIN